MARRPALLLLLAAGCGPQVGPLIERPMEATGSVGVELAIAARATSPAGRVTFDYLAPDIPDLRERKLAPTLTTYAGGQAVFRWTPLAEDVGIHEIDFVARAGGVESIGPVAVIVTPGAGTAPVFRAPVGEGRTLELQREPCADVDVLVEDPDQSEAALALEQPLVQNATLTSSDRNAAALRFCPSAQQVMVATVYPLTLSASDGVNPKVLKLYTIVVRPPPMVACTTGAPMITTTPRKDITTSGNLHIFASVADDLGVAGARLFWSTNPPTNPQQPDLNAFSPIAMARKRGDALTGEYEGVIPNPVVSLASGQSKTIYYVIEASDADPPLGCAHRALSPPMGVYSFVVKKP